MYNLDSEQANEGEGYMKRDRGGEKERERAR